VGAKVKTFFKYCYWWDRRRRQPSNIAFGGIEGEDSLYKYCFWWDWRRKQSPNIAVDWIGDEDGLKLLQSMGLMVKTVFRYFAMNGTVVADRLWSWW